MSANELRRQLETFHNPFANTTQQPKIPDGKTTHSLGLHGQTVGEFSNKEDGASNIVECIIYAGINGIFQVVNTNLENQVYSDRHHYVFGFEGMNAADWSAATTNVARFAVDNQDNYAMWRTVSAGVQLKLLNPTEEDDGWWEAIRINREFRPDEMMLTTVNNSLDRAENGHFGYDKELFVNLQSNTNIANEPSYATGLLRDLHRLQFELHSSIYGHDFIKMERFTEVPPGMMSTLTNSDTINKQVNFVDGFNSGTTGTIKDIHDLYIDQSYDLIYLRLHCRENDSVSAASNGSRFHVNAVSNQEIVFPVQERESRFETSCYNVGTGTMSIHSHGRSGNGAAATLIVES